MNEHTSKIDLAGASLRVVSTMRDGRELWVVVKSGPSAGGLEILAIRDTWQEATNALLSCAAGERVEVLP